MGGEEKKDIANVKLHSPNLWSIEQNRICDIFACNLHGEGERREGDRRRNGGGGDGERKERSDKGGMKKATAR